MKGIRIAGTPLGAATLFDGMWVAHMDFEGRRGRGELICTPHADQALAFKDAVEAMEFWRTQSKTVPLRPDMKPNRPLTAYNVEILDLPKET